HGLPSLPPPDLAAGRGRRYPGRAHSQSLRRRSPVMRWGAALFALALALPAIADDVPPPPGPRDAAARFSLQDQDGRWHSLDEYTGHWVVLYFYPKDGTPGCTKEVCAFRDHIDKVRAAGAEVVGVSVDDVASHAKFAKEHQVPFPLLA